MRMTPLEFLEHYVHQMQRFIEAVKEDSSVNGDLACGLDPAEFWGYVEIQRLFLGCVELLDLWVMDDGYNVHLPSKMAAALLYRCFVIDRAVWAPLWTPNSTLRNFVLELTGYVTTDLDPCLGLVEGMRLRAEQVGHFKLAKEPTYSGKQVENFRIEPWEAELFFQPYRGDTGLAVVLNHP
jgi:hypothetical protein